MAAETLGGPGVRSAGDAADGPDHGDRGDRMALKDWICTGPGRYRGFGEGFWVDFAYPAAGPTILATNYTGEMAGLCQAIAEMMEAAE